ncbi:DUF4381 domain-containing protein [Aquicoccus sp. G2-2]|uniref:DUF4381 domain-containing protein n=1 Tax=Aquicoccus sp. G2-2 TaxID=3092120 RepID=UPI002AE0326B|nr:DUF4381 domain-containing protein [Aquicoccus sp. G2-2]MEA1114856.1 DUF4381 domain-containing protein [Aquicoccus sp. G2-2]
MQAELAKLHDIHLPTPVSWWPVAPGWWLLLIILCLIALALVIWRGGRRQSLRVAALDELKTLRAHEAEVTPPQLATEIGVLLRRVALSRDGRAVSYLSGAGWAAFLADGKAGMAPELAHYIAEAPYAAPANSPDAPPVDQLISAAEHWLRRHA